MTDRAEAERYGSELDKIGDLLTEVHPLGKVKAIGRLECVRALKDVLAEAAATLNEREAEIAGLEVRGWRCFHCDEVLKDRSEAAIHFGPAMGMGYEPICQIERQRFRELEREVQKYHEDDGPHEREIGRLLSQHSTDLRREEEKGYARGVKDGAPYLAEREATIQSLTADIARLREENELLNKIVAEARRLHCELRNVSSRVCELGTKCCITRHENYAAVLSAKPATGEVEGGINL